MFSYGGFATTNNSKGDGTTVNIYDSTITTSKDNSGGIMTTGVGTVTLNMTNQEANGNIVVDSISKLTMNLKTNSSFKGSINNNNEGEVNLILDKTSKITLTGDTYIKSLKNADSTNSNINLNGYKLYVDGVEFKNA